MTLTGAADMDKYQKTQASETGEEQEEPGVPLQASFKPLLDWDDGGETEQDDSPESSDGEWTEDEGSEVDEADEETREALLKAAEEQLEGIMKDKDPGQQA